MFKRLRDFTDPDLIPQSYIFPGDTRCLRQVSLEILFQWVVTLAEHLKQKKSYKKLLKSVGQDCADLFIEKQLYIDLRPIAQAYVRRISVKLDGGDKWLKTHLNI